MSFFFNAEQYKQKKQKKKATRQTKKPQQQHHFKQGGMKPHLKKNKWQYAQTEMKYRFLKSSSEAVPEPSDKVSLIKQAYK